MMSQNLVFRLFGLPPAWSVNAKASVAESVDPLPASRYTKTNQSPRSESKVLSFMALPLDLLCWPVFCPHITGIGRLVEVVVVNVS